MISIQLIYFGIMFFASIFPLYLSVIARKTRPALFSLILLLGLMTLVHSFFHLSMFLGLFGLGAMIEFASVAILIVFGAILLVEEE